MTNSLVSVIIPAYNRADSVGNAVKSVIEQDYRPLDIIIIDDGSKDNTQSALKPMLTETENLSVRYHYQDNAGVSAARNYGIRLARGEYISFLDSDDILLPHKISRQIALMKKENADVCYGKALYKSSSWKQINKVEAPGNNPVEKFLLFKNITPNGCWMFSANLLKDNELTFREGCSWGEDNEFLLKTLCLGKKISFIDDAMMQVTVGRSDGLSKFQWDKASKDIFIYQKILSWLEVQHISMERKIKYKRIINKYTIPDLVINRIWGNTADKENARKILLENQEYCSFATLLNLPLTLPKIKLLIKYVILSFKLRTPMSISGGRNANKSGQFICGRYFSVYAWGGIAA